MTAAVISVEPSRAIAWTDAAILDDSMLVDSFERRTVPVHGMAAAVVCLASGEFATLFAAALTEEADDGCTFGMLMARGHADGAAARLKPILDALPQMQLAFWIVGWDEITGSAGCLQFSSMVGVDNLFTPGWSTTLGMAFPPMTEMAWVRLAGELGPTDAQGFDIGRIGIPIMEEHRHVSQKERREGITAMHPVGQIHQTVVSADGVSQVIVHTWPEDEIGKPFDPAPAPGPIGGNIIGMDRAARRRALQKG